MSNVFAQFGRERVSRRSSKRRAPRLECLEDRRLPSTLYPVTTAADGAPNSLRSDIITANENLQDNTLILQAGTYTLTVPDPSGQPSGAATGDLDLTPVGHTITIVGQGAGATFIDGGNIDRVFQIEPNVHVVISGLTIEGGFAQVPGSIAFGGGVFNAGTLELDDVVMQNCTASGANGQNGTPGNNTSPGSPALAALGGGIYNVGTLTLNQCIIRSNFAQGGNGGNGSASGDPNASGGNGGNAFGGGIYNAGSLTVSQSTIANNSALGGSGGSGGSDAFGVGPNGGAGGSAYGGGLSVNSISPQTLIIDSTISGNLVAGGFGGPGGAGGNEGNAVTDPGSQGGTGGNGGSAQGGGIAAYNSVSVYNSTIASNQASGSPAGRGGIGGPGSSSGSEGQSGYTGPAFAGGIWAPSDPSSSGLVNSASTIIALNTSAPFQLTGSPDDTEATFANATNTLLGISAGANGISNAVAGNLVGVDPKLGPLEDNGGPTPTMALLPGSPAIDAGANPLGLTSDQRGYSPRVVGAAADIGAYELGATAPPGEGGGGGGAGTGPVHIEATVIKLKGHKAIRVTDPATGAVKFTVFPFGKAYHGTFVITTADLDSDGVDDLIVRRPRGHHKFITKIFSGINGSPLPSNLA
jgi:hypothetical protein